MKTETHIDLNGVLLPLHIHKHHSSKRYVVRYHPASDHVSLTLPKRAAVKTGLAFVHEKLEWLVQQRAPFSQRVEMKPGVEISVLGKRYVLKHEAKLRGLVRATEAGELIIPGAEESFSRRATDWLKRTLKEYAIQEAARQAAVLNLKIKRVQVRDVTSRWGSCSSDGDLVFSWRLVFAPREALDYVIAHEVAHLVEMNHGPKFWKVVELLCPAQLRMRQWFKKHSNELYRFG